MGKYSHYDETENVIFCDPTEIPPTEQAVDEVFDEVIEIAKGLLPRKVFLVVCYKDVKMNTSLSEYYGQKVAQVHQYLRGAVRYAADDVVTRIALRSITVKYNLQKSQAHIYASKEEALEAVRKLEQASEQK